MPDSMHRLEGNEHHVVDAALDAARRRVEADLRGELPLGDPKTPAELDALAGATITPDGLGAGEALRLWTEVLEPSCLSVDHHGFLAFVPQAPSEFAVLGDVLVSASSVYAGSWLEGSGAVWAENQVIRWLAQLAGMPEGAGGVFAPGGTYGNLSAIVAARESAVGRSSFDAERVRQDGWAIVCGEHAHSSVAQMARVTGCQSVAVEGERLEGRNLAEVLERDDLRGRVAAVVATAGSTNLGRVDRLGEIADVCEEQDLWFHVDGAYGLAGIVAPSVASRFAGLGRCDSFIVDPHKWLFAPFDSCAVVYREPLVARAAHSQKAGYLDVLTEGAEAGDWNPADFQVGLSRRARGVPLWFALASHGTSDFTAAVERTIATARIAADLVNAHPRLELLEEPELSVVAFTRPGWEQADYDRWSDSLREQGEAFVVPSKHDGEPILRMAFINPRTTADHVRAILDTL